MHPFLEMKNNFYQHKTNLDLFLEEKVRLEKILIDPNESRHNKEGSEWSLFFVNQVLVEEEETDQTKRAQQLESIKNHLTQIVWANDAREKSIAQEKNHQIYVNALPPVLRAASPILN